MPKLSLSGEAHAAAWFQTDPRKTTLYTALKEKMHFLAHARHGTGLPQPVSNGRIGREREV